MKQFWQKHGQMIINVVVFLAIGRWVVLYTLDKWNKGILWDFVEIAFLAHNVIMLGLILIRRRHVGIDRNIFNQGVALAAFFSGLLFRDDITANPALLTAAKVTIGAAVVLGTATLINLGKSFGILIAIRKIKTNGLYAVIRHPMYFTDIVWKVGVILKKPCAFNAAVMAFSIACYVYRALLEEKFLARYPEYREYMEKVRYRLIPGVF